MRNINYFDKELSVEEYVKKEVCKNAGTQSVAFTNITVEKKPDSRKVK